MQFKSRDRMLGLGANIHQCIYIYICLLDFCLLPVLNYTLNFVVLMVTPVVEAEVKELIMAVFTESTSFFF
jgi:hypothetical protein